MQSQQIEYTEDNQLKVPDCPIVPYLEGDGTGPDIWRATQLVLDAAVEKAYGGIKKISWLQVLAGERAFKETGDWLPQQTVDTLRRYRVSIKGPLTTPIGEGFRSLNVALRQIMDLYACVRPVKYVNGTPSPVKRPQDVDMIIFRENTEDVYAGIEWEANSPVAKKIIDLIAQETGRQVRPDSGIGIKPISRTGTRRLVAMAIEYALENGRRSVTLVHKGNIMKYTEGAFRNWGYELARERFPEAVVTEDELWKRYDGQVPKGRIVIQDRIADSMFQQILLRPAEYDVLATPNLNGDYLSDALAATVGGLGMAPGANIGDGYAVFEATHGTAPKYAGQDKVNPGSLILSGAMMLDYLGWKEAAVLVRDSLSKTVGSKIVTYDLARQLEGARKVKCSEFGMAMIEQL